MKTKGILPLLFILFAIPAMAQIPSVLKGDPDADHYGISKEMTFAVIINTQESKEELINKTRDLFISYRLVDPADFNLDDLSATQSEFTVPFGYRQGLVYQRMMVQAAVYLFFDATFSFNTEGQVMITFTNFREKAFFPINDKGYFGFDSEDPKMTDYYGLYATAMTTQSGIGKFLILINGGISNLKSTIDNLNAEMDEQFAIMDKVMIEQGGDWVSTPEEIIALYSPNLMEGGGEVMINMARERAENNYLLVVTNKRWKTYFQELLIDIFKEVAGIVDGEISAIAIDGQTTFDREGDLLVPVDPKERKKWLKKGQSL